MAAVVDEAWGMAAMSDGGDAAVGDHDNGAESRETLIDVDSLLESLAHRHASLNSL